MAQIYALYKYLALQGTIILYYLTKKMPGNNGKTASEHRQKRNTKYLYYKFLQRIHTEIQERKLQARKPVFRKPARNIVRLRDIY
jgi:uncharacterized membrane protein